MQKTIYVSESDQHLFTDAQIALGESSTSATIVTALRLAIELKKQRYETHVITAGARQYKIIGKELMIYKQQKTSFRAFKTMSGKVVVFYETEHGGDVFKFDGYEEFSDSASSLLPEDIFRRIKLSLVEDDMIEVID